MKLMKLAAFAALVILLLAVGALATRWHAARSSPLPSADAPLDATAPEARSSRTQTTPRLIQNLQTALEKNPYSARGWATLGSAYLQRVREDADPNHYARAEEAFRKALALEPNNFDAVSGMGALALARHQFHEALTWGERGRAINPDNAGIYGVLGDAHLELGEYDAAFASFQTMVDTRPDLNSYARVSYAQELMGARESAIENMQAAVNAGGMGSEARSWALVQLGNLYFDRGDLDRAHAAYQESLQNWNDYAYARGGLAKVYAARGEYAQAIETYTRLIQTIPLPEFVIGLGDVYAVSGDTANAEKQYALVGAMQALFKANGVDVDAELALFQADHQIRLAETLRLARAAYERRPSIVVADIVAWTLYQNGDYRGAQAMMERALKLGTRSALMDYHAGMIAYQLGDKTRTRDFLNRALTLNPHFSLRYAAPARDLLNELSDTQRLEPQSKSLTALGRTQ